MTTGLREMAGRRALTVTAAGLVGGCQRLCVLGLGFYRRLQQPQLTAAELRANQAGLCKGLRW